MELTFDNNIPIYIQLLEYMKIYLISGVFQCGEKLPSVRDFAITFKVNPNTMQKALQELELGVDKHLYFIDLNVILIDENTINEKLTSIIDYLTRDVSFGTKYNIVVDNNPDNTIKMIKSKNKMIFGLYQTSLYNLIL